LQFKKEQTAGLQADYMDGAYRREVTEKVYRILEDEARKQLQAGRTVILDASFADAARRKRMQDLAAECNVPHAVLYCHCPREMALVRLHARIQEGTDASDGRIELYDLQKDHFQVPSDAEPVIEIETSCPADYTVNRVLGRMPGIIGEIGVKKNIK
jgi:predicted kinase